MDLSSILAQARRIHEDVMDDLGDTCRIEHPGPDVWDEEQQKTVVSYTEVWAGPCRWPAPAAGVPVLNPSGAVSTSSAPTVRVPAGVSGVKVGDRVTVTACPGDPALAGQQLWVTFDRLRSLNSARYLVCSFEQ